MFGSGTTTLIISNKETNDIMKIVKSFEEPGLLIKGLSQTIKNEVKEQKGGFLRMLLVTLTLFRMRGVANLSPPLPVFPCNIYKRRN